MTLFIYLKRLIPLKRLLVLLGCLAAGLPLYAQPTTPEVKPLSIGDTVPDVVFHHMLNYKDSTARLSDFDGKPVILDFFATWCGSCIAALPKLDSLQRRFGSRIQILVVSPEPIQKMAKFLQHNSIGKTVNLPIVISDSILGDFFPHRLIPHEVWVDSKNKVVAITGAGSVTVANLQKLLSGTLPMLPLKRDIMNFDRTQPLLKDDNGGGKENLIYRSVFTKYLNGLAGGMGRTLNIDSTASRIYYINQPILSLYAAATGHYSNRIILEVKNPDRYILDGQLWIKWMQKNSYCYELTVPVMTSRKKIKKLMLQDLNRYLGLNGREEKRIVACWALVLRKNNDGLFKTKGGTSEIKLHGSKNKIKYIRNYPFSKLIDVMNYYHPGGVIRPVVIDETHYTGNVDLRLKIDNIHDIPAMKRALQPYGLDLVPVKRKLDVFVLTETDAGNETAR